MDQGRGKQTLTAYATNYLIDTKCSVIMDAEATRAIRQAEVGTSRPMLDRTEKRFGIGPEWFAADTAYGPPDNLGWLVEERQITPFIPVIDPFGLYMDPALSQHSSWVRIGGHDC